MILLYRTAGRFGVRWEQNANPMLVMIGVVIGQRIFFMGAT
jgi:hypothetical protein